MFEFALIGIPVAFVLVFWLQHRAKVQQRQREEEQRRLRREGLIAKYGSEEIADAIMAQKVWQGMTSEQLIESWGQPQDRDETVYKTKTKQTWKYGNNGKNRYRQRVYVENDCVVGWQNQ
jgi:hypothetical protein